MILVFGGTTEGRTAAETLERAGKSFYYSTKSPSQKVVLSNGIRLTGPMDANDIKEFIGKNDIRLIVDAAHPFAINLHKNIAEAAECADIPVIRFERKYTDKYSENIVICESFDDAVNKINQAGVRKLLALTGVQTIGKLSGIGKATDVFFRILNREDSIAKALESGIDKNKLIFYDENDPGGDKIVELLRPDAIITKESGESGGFEYKKATAEEWNTKLYVVRRPQLKETTATVYGQYGLRRWVERLLPGFFDLRTGFTTGSCATAASKAALEHCLSSNKIEFTEFNLPDGEPMGMNIIESRKIGDRWTATVIKDAGDDPDVTDGCRITASIKKNEGEDIEIYGGEGVGKVTLPGLGLKIGDWAINPVPKKMIETNLREIYPSGGLDVEISVENGKEIAKKTFNEKVGVVDGISILGTSGIVMPFSHEAFVESIRREISVAIAAGTETILINSGARSENVLKGMFKNFPSYAFIHYGNAIGETLEAAERCGVKKIIMGIMIGKAVKMAEGHLNTHSHNVRINKGFIVSVSRDAGVSNEIAEKIEKMNLARELWDILPSDKFPDFYSRIKELCEIEAKKIFKGSIDVILIRD